MYLVDQRLRARTSTAGRRRSTSSATRSALPTRASASRPAGMVRSRPIPRRGLPTMHPFSIADHRPPLARGRRRGGPLRAVPRGRRSADHDGTITGTVTRCGTGRPGARRERASDQRRGPHHPAHARDRLRRRDGRVLHDQRASRPANYNVVVEPLAGDDDFLNRPGHVHPRSIPTSTQEFLNPSVEGDCGQDTDPAASEDLPVGATGVKTADAKVQGASFALVVDVTGSMGPEIGLVKTALTAMVTALETSPTTFPLTSIVTFEDTARSGSRSRDPDALRDMISSLTTHSTRRLPGGVERRAHDRRPAARQSGGTGGARDGRREPAQRSDRGRRWTTSSREGSASLSVLLSGSCPPGLAGAAATRAAAPLATWNDTTLAERDTAGPRPSHRRARSRGRHSHLHRGEPLLRRAVQLPARGEGRRRGPEAALLEHALQHRDLLGAPGGRRRESHRRAAGHHARRRADRREHGLPRREHRRGIAGTGVSVDSADVLSPTRMIVRLTSLRMPRSASAT